MSLRELIASLKYYGYWPARVNSISFFLLRRQWINKDIEFIEFVFLVDSMLGDDEFMLIA